MDIGKLEEQLYAKLREVCLSLEKLAIIYKLLLYNIQASATCCHLWIAARSITKQYLPGAKSIIQQLTI